MWTRPTPAGAPEKIFKPKKAANSCKKAGACQARILGSAGGSLLCVGGTGDWGVEDVQKRLILADPKPDIAKMMPLKRICRGALTLAHDERALPRSAVFSDLNN